MRQKAMLKTAMVMAAGHGTRMRPLTNDRSKAMVVAAGRPLIDHMLDRLETAGVERVIVNVHAYADHLEAHLKARKSELEIIISDERDALLETGGGVVKALPLLGTKPIFICNIDAVWQPFEPVLESLIAAWKPKEMDELLLCARSDWALGYAGQGDFDIHKDGRLTRRAGEHSPHIYAGVQIFKPHLAKPYIVRRFSRNKIWDASLTRRKLFGHELPGYWMHVGDPSALLAAEAVIKQAVDAG